MKVDLHIHTSDDPVDVIPYTTRELIARAAQLGFGALAITLHDKQRHLGDIAGYARELGITLIPGVERTIHGRHVLLLNFPSMAEADSVDSFESLAAMKLRYPEGLVVAPHPFYPHTSCLRSLMDRYANLFDAVEINACYTTSIDFNRPAKRWAAAHGKPLVANSDAHRLPMLGTSCSLVEAEADATAICAAIRAGRVRVQTRPLSFLEMGVNLASMTLSDLRPKRTDRSFPATAEAGNNQSPM